MVDRQKTESNSRGGDIKLETSFEWSSTGVGVGTNIIFDIYKWFLSSKVLTFANDTKVSRTVKTDADKDIYKMI